MFDKILMSSRFVVLIAVAGSFLASFAALLAGGVQTIAIVAEMVQKIGYPKGTKVLAYSFVEVVDLFLIGTVFISSPSVPTSCLSMRRSRCPTGW